MILTPRWTKLTFHQIQNLYWNSRSRFNVVPSGRRSGKTEIAKRRIVKAALKWHKTNDGNFILSAPTNKQAKEIYWDDIKNLVPNDALLTPEKAWKSINESSLTLSLWNKARLRVVGLDKPERIEGSPIDGMVLDEYGNMKERVWTHHVRPALSTIGRLGWADLIGVPEGRNHYYRIANSAMAKMLLELPWEESWSYFHWKSSEILSPSEIEAARSELDELTFQQEYEGSFVNFTGRAYYSFTRELNASKRVQYNSELDLHLCFDFNVEPGVAAAIQEVDGVTCVVGEVYIPKNSNTIRVCDKLLTMYGSHPGNVWLYGDASGGARGSAKVAGSDWDLVKAALRPVFGVDKLLFRVDRRNPAERSRVNSVNSRCKSASGEIRLLVDPINCKHSVDDFEGVVLLEGGSGEIDKGDDPTKTHLTDAIGYYIHKRHPIVGGKTEIEIL